MIATRHYPTKPEGSGMGPHLATRQRLPLYAALFAERLPDGAPLALTEIGKRMGTTRENVRQMRKKYFPELESVRVDRTSHTREKRGRERFARPYLFRLMVRRWLAMEGYFQCCTCRLVKCIEADALKAEDSGRPCKRCNADKVARNHQTERGKRKLLEWRAANPGRIRDMSARYRHKGTGKPPQGCPGCGTMACPHFINPKILMSHKRPDGAWCRGQPAILG